MRFQEKFFIANWKMNKTLSESMQICESVENHVNGQNVWITPSFCNLYPLKSIFNELKFGAQNVAAFESGAYTGEVSAKMLSDMQIPFSLVGHSERRYIFHENDLQVSHKLNLLVKEKILPVLCVGETLEQRNANLTEAYIANQLKAALHDLKDQTFDLFIAYEPVWAVGSSKPASSVEVNHILNQIKLMTKMIAPNVTVKTLYGGSVDISNIDTYLKQPMIDGVLVGGASLKLETFLEFLKS
jgi:triosephosphate isomerase